MHTSNILSNDKKLLCATACCKLYEVDAFLRWPVKRTKLAYYSVLIDDLLQILVELSIPYVKCQGNSIVSREGLAPIVKAYSRLIPVDGLVL